MSVVESTSPRRRPKAGGYARGDETRARIIAAALDVFGTTGYARASTRQIAARAGVNPPALQYYFDSKEGLHKACAQFLIDRFREAMSPVLNAAESVRAGEPDQATEALCRIFDTFIDITLNATDLARWNRFMARGQVDGAGPAFPLIQESVVVPLHATCARLVGIATGRSRDDDLTRLRSVTILSQLSAFSINRESTMRKLDWTDFHGTRAELVKTILRAHTRAALEAERPTRSRPSPRSASTP